MCEVRGVEDVVHTCPVGVVGGYQVSRSALVMSVHTSQSQPVAQASRVMVYLTLLAGRAYLCISRQFGLALQVTNLDITVKNCHL